MFHTENKALLTNNFNSIYIKAIYIYIYIFFFVINNKSGHKVADINDSYPKLENKQNGLVNIHTS